MLADPIKKAYASSSFSAVLLMIRSLAQRNSLGKAQQLSEAHV